MSCVFFGYLSMRVLPVKLSFRVRDLCHDHPGRFVTIGRRECVGQLIIRFRILFYKIVLIEPN